MRKRNSLLFIVISLVFLMTSCSSGQKDNSDKKAELFYTYGTQKMIDQEYSQALEALENANQLKPNDTKTLNNLGLAYFFKDRPEKAKRLILKAIEIDPKNSDARNNLASIYFKEGKIDLAEKQYKEVLKDLVYRYTYRVKYNLSLIELKRGNKQKAKDYLKEVLGYTLDYCPAPYQLGILLHEEGKIAEAIKNFNIAKTGKCKDQPAAYFELGKVYQTLGEEEKAIAEFNHVIEAFPRTQYAKRSLKFKNKLMKKIYYSKKNKNNNL